MDKGWIKLNRQVQDHWIWKNHEYAYAWIDLLLSVNRANTKILVDNELMVIKRGQMLTSVYKLSQRWGWSRKRTYKFILALEKDGMLRKNSTTRYTIITIVNYGKYQDKGTTNDTTKVPTEVTTKGQQGLHKQEYIKNEKEIKEEQPPTSNEVVAAEEEEERIEVIPGYTQKELDESFIDGFIPMTQEEWEALPEG